MKRFIGITLLLLLAACHRSDKPAKQVKPVQQQAKSKFITQPTAIVVIPSNRLITKYQQQYKDDFTTIVEDDTYYISQSEHYLDSVKINKLEHESEGSVNFKTPAGQVYEMKLDTLFFGIILFNGKDRPISADIVDLQTDYNKYMKR